MSDLRDLDADRQQLTMPDRWETSTERELKKIALAALDEIDRLTEWVAVEFVSDFECAPIRDHGSLVANKQSIREIANEAAVRKAANDGK